MRLKPDARQVARVGAREHQACVHAVDDPLRQQGRCQQRRDRPAQARRPARQRIGQLRDEQRREQAKQREDRQQPASEVAALQAHEREVQRDPRDEHPAERGLLAPYAERAAERGQRRQPAKPPGERPQVVDEPALLGRAELALRFGRERGLAGEFALEVVVVEDRVGVREQEHRERGEARERHAPERAPPERVALDPRLAQRDGRQIGQQHDPRGVLARARETEACPGEQVIARAAFAQDACGAEQRQRQRRQGRHVVERQMRVEHRQERDRLERGGEQARAARQQPRAGHVQQPQRHDAEHRGRDPRQRVHLAGIGVERMQGALAAAVPDREQDVQQIGERRRVGEVVRVQTAFEHLHRTRHEVVGLVGVVHVGKPLPDAPQAQRQSNPEHDRQPSPRPRARAFNSSHAPRGRGWC